MIVSGLAKLCGISHPALLKLLSNLVTKEPPKRLKALTGKSLDLVTNFAKRGSQRLAQAISILLSQVQ